MRFQSLQASRAVAAILVVAYHTSQSILEDPRFWAVKPLHGFFDFGNAAVYFFFVLSGFIIFAAHERDIGRPSAVGRYLTRRAIRIYPIYWIVLIPVVLLYLLFPSAGKIELSAHSVILNSFLLLGPTSHASLSVAWTLFQEIAFYLIFALLLLNRRVGTLFLALWGFSCSATVLWPRLFGGFYLFLPVNLLFLMGIGVFALVRRFRPPPNFPVAGAGGALFLATGLGELQFGHLSFTLPLYGLASALILAGLVWTEEVYPVRIPAFLMLLGDASYCIYLCHYPALSLIARVYLRLFGRTHPDLAFASLVVLATLPGVLLHLAIERPLLSTLRRRFEGSRPTSAPLGPAKLQS
jgi:exopolysaccharide production protein ExoZ